MRCDEKSFKYVSNSYAHLPRIRRRNKANHQSLSISGLLHANRDTPRGRTRIPQGFISFAAGISPGQSSSMHTAGACPQALAGNEVGRGGVKKRDEQQQKTAEHSHIAGISTRISFMGQPSWTSERSPESELAAAFLLATVRIERLDPRHGIMERVALVGGKTAIAVHSSIS